ncbi:DNA polymerase III subunit delta [Bacteroidia bacterium]|nr:DNA polymerase III subunit delta [Bacteroidia bacterium]GHT04838.1 DNA polymerase III subunit delta [Bacteroidia bacterium]GHT50543.1 DNA polymerase III subunit delta [Bacteroidia bacterium]
MAKDLSFNEIKGNIQLKKFMPVYLFQGEESYYIDQLTDLLIASVLDEPDRDFNQTIVYGLETNVATIINACKRYPMMAERQLVVVKEAQGLKNIDELVHYVKNPLSSTVLVINYKYGKLDGRKKLTGEIAKTGIVFESKKLYENKIPDFIVGYLRGKDRSIDLQTAQVLTDYLGNDLSKITNELDKLLIALPAGQKRITPEQIEQNIGISKDFNNYELQKAIATGDVLKANRIARYFEENQKNNPLILTLNVLFGFFTNLMICQFEKDQSRGHLMEVLGFKWDFQITDYMEAMRRYKPVKTMNNIALIREYDAKGKGFGNSSVPPGKLLIELLYKLMHAYQANNG